MVTTLQASPGKLSKLIDAVKAYRAEQRGRVIVMRHSQGDHWDLMLLEPTGGNPMEQPDFSALADFQHSFLALSGGSFKGLQHQFVTGFGSDVDVFTLGFHRNWASFAAGPSVSDAEAEAAAKRAGFQSREDIGLFLRSLLRRHQDTLALPVN